MAAFNNDMEDENVIYSSREALKIAQAAAGDSILLLGQTGGGKSSVANACLATTGLFEESASVRHSCTQDVQVVEGSFFSQDEELCTVIDTPGFLDTEGRSAMFLAALLDFIENFPKDRLRLVVVTLPITAPRANSTYTDMLAQVRILLGANAMKHMVFVMTHVNKWNAGSDAIRARMLEWRQWVAEKHNIDDAKMVVFDYRRPIESLADLLVRFRNAKPFTPEAVANAREYVEQAGMDVEQRLAQSEALQQLKAVWAQRIEEQRAAAEEVARQSREQTELSQRMRTRAAKQEAEVAALNAKIRDLEARPPRIVYQYVQRPRCLSGDSLALLASDDDEDSVRAVPLMQLKEGDRVATLNERNERIFSTVYFVDGQREQTPMVVLHYLVGGGEQGVTAGKAMLTSEHIMFAAERGGGSESMRDALLIRADKVLVGDQLFVVCGGGGGGDAQLARVTALSRTTVPTKWTVLTRDHTLLCDGVLTSCHVFDHSAGIAENTLMLFVYDHVSPRFVASAANKWFCRQVDRLVHTLFAD
jgi:predicted GTPase